MTEPHSDLKIPAESTNALRNIQELIPCTWHKLLDADMWNQNFFTDVRLAFAHVKIVGLSWFKCRTACTFDEKRRLATVSWPSYKGTLMNLHSLFWSDLLEAQKIENIPISFVTLFLFFAKSRWWGTSLVTMNCWRSLQRARKRAKGKGERSRRSEGYWWTLSSWKWSIIWVKSSCR